MAGFFDLSVTDIVAISSIALSAGGFIYARFKARVEAKLVAKKAIVEAARLADAAIIEAARLAEQAKTEAIRLAEKAISSRDTMMDEVRTRIVAIETRQDIIWDFLIRRSKAELVTRGWGTIKSPLALTGEATKCLEHLLPVMLPVYQAIMKATPDADERALFIAFEATFGDMLVKEVCIPFNMTSGACVVAAVELCKMNTDGGKHIDTPPTSGVSPTDVPGELSL